jgi:ankyrin repeat protein
MEIIFNGLHHDNNNDSGNNNNNNLNSNINMNSSVEYDIEKELNQLSEQLYNCICFINKTIDNNNCNELLRLASKNPYFKELIIQQIEIKNNPNFIYDYIRNNIRWLTKNDLKYKLVSYNNFNPNYKYEDGNTLLTFCILRLNTSLTKYLIKIGADINIPSSNNKNTPLHCAIFRGNLKIIKLLLDKNVDINTPNNENMTPLYYSILYDKFNIAEYLINSNAELNIQDSVKGYTPLILSIKKTVGGPVFLVKLLLKNKADPNIVDKKGKSALCYALKKDLPGTIVALIKYNAKINDMYNHTVAGQSPMPMYKKLLNYATENKNYNLMKLLSEKYKINENNVDILEMSEILKILKCIN